MFIDTNKILCPVTSLLISVKKQMKTTQTPEAETSYLSLKSKTENKTKMVKHAGATIWNKLTDMLSGNLENMNSNLFIKKVKLYYLTKFTSI